MRVRVDKRNPPTGQFATARLEEVQLLHQRIMTALSHAPEPLRLKRNVTAQGLGNEFGGPLFRQNGFAEVKDFFDNPHASRENALNPFLVMQGNLYVTQVCLFIILPCVREAQGSIQQLVRFVIEQARDDLLRSLHGHVNEDTVAEEREAIASDLLSILHSIPIQSIATNGPSLVSSCAFDIFALLNSCRSTKSALLHRRCWTLFIRQRSRPPPLLVLMPIYVSGFWLIFHSELTHTPGDFLSILSEIERNYLLDDDKDATSSGDGMALFA